MTLLVVRPKELVHKMDWMQHAVVQLQVASAAASGLVGKEAPAGSTSSRTVLAAMVWVV